MYYLFGKNVQELSINVSSQGIQQSVLAQAIQVEELPEKPIAMQGKRLGLFNNNGVPEWRYVDVVAEVDERIEKLEQENEALKQSQSEQDDLIMDIILGRL